MKTKEITSKEVWEDFLKKCEEKTFLDSWNWGEFQKLEKNKIWRLGFFKNEELAAIALAIKIEAKRGNFLFVPHGPNTTNPKSEFQILKILLEELKKIAEKEKASFIRIAPISKKNEENEKIFKDLGFREAPIHIHPETTWELDISLPEEDLLKRTRKTTRYLVKQAEKNSDIKIIQSRNIEDLKKFYSIYQETVERHNFTPFSLKYLENQFNSFLPDNRILMFLGEYKRKIVSSAIIVFWQDRAFYHHGASLSGYNNNKTPVSYLLQWEAIKEAKRRGCKIYNFWGVAPFVRSKPGIDPKIEVIDEKHPWAGLSLFKMGFGGYKKEYVKTQDFPLSYRYYLSYIIEKLRKRKRRL